MAATIGRNEVRRLPYFTDLNEADAERAAHLMSPVNLESGEHLFRQGDDGGWIYILIYGEIEISARVGTGDASVLCTLYAPALLGEMALLLDEPRTATATATADCVLWQISREEIKRALERGDMWATRLLMAMTKILAARLADTNRQLVTTIHSSRRNTDRHLVDMLEDLRQRLYADLS